MEATAVVLAATSYTIWHVRSGKITLSLLRFVEVFFLEKKMAKKKRAAFFEGVKIPHCPTGGPAWTIWIRQRTKALATLCPILAETRTSFSILS